MKMLDHVTAAATTTSSRWTDRGSIASDYFHANLSELCPAFDLWLVKTGHPLAAIPGSPESRFVAMACRMAELAEQARQSRQS